MITFAAGADVMKETFAERARLVEVLGTLCGLAPHESADHCGAASCGYFDEAKGRCGLLVLDLPSRLGPEAMRWFVAHRTTKDLLDTAGADDVLRARTCSF
ncbi:MAG: hypothetical protein WEB06_19255 [Actinomycetota bacterium]